MAMLARSLRVVMFYGSDFCDFCAECCDSTGVLTCMFHFRPFAVKHFSFGMLLGFGFCV